MPDIPLCASCATPVYPHEAIKLPRHFVFHKSCAKCQLCKNVVSEKNGWCSNGKCYCSEHAPKSRPKALSYTPQPVNANTLPPQPRSRENLAIPLSGKRPQTASPNSLNNQGAQAITPIFAAPNTPTKTTPNTLPIGSYTNFNRPSVNPSVSTIPRGSASTLSPQSNGQGQVNQVTATTSPQLQSLSLGRSSPQLNKNRPSTSTSQSSASPQFNKSRTNVALSPPQSASQLNNSRTNLSPPALQSSPQLSISRSDLTSVSLQSSPQLQPSRPNVTSAWQNLGSRPNVSVSPTSLPPQANGEAAHNSRSVSLLTAANVNNKSSQSLNSSADIQAPHNTIFFSNKNYSQDTVYFKSTSPNMNSKGSSPMSRLAPSPLETKSPSASPVETFASVTRTKSNQGAPPSTSRLYAGSRELNESTPQINGIAVGTTSHPSASLGSLSPINNRKDLTAQSNNSSSISINNIVPNTTSYKSEVSLHLASTPRKDIDPKVVSEILEKFNSSTEKLLRLATASNPDLFQIKSAASAIDDVLINTLPIIEKGGYPTRNYSRLQRHIASVKQALGAGRNNVWKGIPEQMPFLFSSLRMILMDCLAGSAREMIAPSLDHRIEMPGSLDPSSTSENPYADCPLEHVRSEAWWYRNLFEGQEHTNYISTATGDTTIISFKKEKTATVNPDGSEQENYMVIIRHKSGSQYFTSMSNHGGKTKRTAPTPKFIIQMLDPSITLTKYRKIEKDSALEHELRLLDDIATANKYKIGMLYAKSAEQSEEEMFCCEKGSSNFDQFQDIMGTKIQLAGWEGYTGGLDVKRGGTGQESYHSRWREFEVMYHNSTLLPFAPDDPQQIQRKRHLGNGKTKYVVCIVFLNSKVGRWKPATIQTHFIHVTIVVREEYRLPGKNPVYRVGVVCRDDVPSFGPALPSPPLFEDPEVLRDFIFAKMINGENAAYSAPRFKVPQQRTREQMMERINEEFRTAGSMTGGISIVESASQKLNGLLGRAYSLSTTTLSSTPDRASMFNLTSNPGSASKFASIKSSRNTLSSASPPDKSFSASPSDIDLNQPRNKSFSAWRSGGKATTAPQFDTIEDVEETPSIIEPPKRVGVI